MKNGLKTRNGFGIFAVLSGFILGVLVFGSIGTVIFTNEIKPTVSPQVNAKGFTGLAGSDITNLNNPFGDLTPLSSVPVVPEVPSLPGMPSKGQIKVLGLMAPDIATLSMGNQFHTVKAHSDSPFGYVGSITSKGVYVDGEFVEFQ